MQAIFFFCVETEKQDTTKAFTENFAAAFQKKRRQKSGQQPPFFKVSSATVFNPLLNSQDGLLSSIGRSKRIFPPPCTIETFWSAIE